MIEYFGFFHVLNRLVKHDYDAYNALVKLSNNDWNGVIFTNDVIINYFNYISKSTYRIDYTRDVVRPNAPVFFFNKHSMLTWMFNRKIEICQESGLVLHWTAQYTHSRMKNNQKQPKKLGIESILAALEISAVLYLIAFIIFIMEILSHEYRRIKQFLDYFTY